MKSASRGTHRKATAESETCEFKKSLAELKEGLVSVAAILNKHGTGELWFGIKNDGQPLGLDVNEKTLRDVSQAIAAHIEPRIYPHITRDVLGQASCIKVAFEGTDAPYYAYGRAYMRVADEDRQLAARDLERLILAKHGERLHWDDQPCGMDVAALNVTTLRAFVKRAGLTWDTPANALEKLGLLQKGKPVNAAPLFFAKKPPMELRCAVFATTDSATIIDRHDFMGGMLELIEEAQKYILKNIHIGMRLEGLYRKDVPEVSVEAMREAIINAFCHRDYRDPDYIQVAIFKDRVEIRSPGGLYGGLTLEDLRHGHISRRRNPLIAELFRRIEMVEAWGRGMPLIRKNEPSVTFKEIAGIFIVGFARPSFTEQSENAANASEEAVKPPAETQRASQGNPKETPRKPQGNPKETLILGAMEKTPTLSIKELAVLCGLSTNSIQHYVNKLKRAERIRHVGATKGGRWEVLP